MRLPINGILLVGLLTLAVSASAQTPPAPSAITRTVIAATKLPTVTDVPLHFRAVAVTIPRGEKSSAAPGTGILYQLSGSTEILAGAETRMLRAAEGLFIAAGTTAALKAGNEEPSRFILLAASGIGLGSACCCSTCCRNGIISHGGTNPRPEAGQL
jgi:hypothetical protein